MSGDTRWTGRPVKFVHDSIIVIHICINEHICIRTSLAYQSNECHLTSTVGVCSALNWHVYIIAHTTFIAIAVLFFYLSLQQLQQPGITFNRFKTIEAVFVFVDDIAAFCAYSRYTWALFTNTLTYLLTAMRICSSVPNKSVIHFVIEWGWSVLVRAKIVQYAKALHAQAIYR